MADFGMRRAIGVGITVLAGLSVCFQAGAETNTTETATSIAVPVSSVAATSGTANTSHSDVPTTVTLPDGIRYQDLVVGTGAETSGGMKLSIHFRLKLVGEKLLDDTEAKMLPVPFTFKYDSEEVISGLNIGMKGMRIGGRRVIIIPPKLAYGEKGKGPIPENAELIYDVRFVDMHKADALEMQ